jgi:hypothetical protein
MPHQRHCVLVLRKSSIFSPIETYKIDTKKPYKRMYGQQTRLNWEKETFLPLIICQRKQPALFGKNTGYMVNSPYLTSHAGDGPQNHLFDYTYIVIKCQLISCLLCASGIPIKAPKILGFRHNDSY